MTTKTQATPEMAATASAEKMATAGKEAFETVMKMGADATAENYKNAAAFSKEQLDMTKKSYGKAAVYGKDNLEAMSEATAVMVAGWEAYYEGVVDYTKTAMAENMDLMQRFFTVKTPQEFMDLQVEATNKAVNRVVTQSTKMGTIAADTMTKAFEPIKDRIDTTVEAFVKPYAA